MGNKEKVVDLDDVQKEIVSICEKRYGNIDHNRYFVAEDSNVHDVRQYILNNLSVEERKKSIYLDMSVYILQAGKDVFISLS